MLKKKRKKLDRFNQLTIVEVYCECELMNLGLNYEII